MEGVVSTFIDCFNLWGLLYYWIAGPSVYIWYNGKIGFHVDALNYETI